MDALRCPPADADVTKLSGGERRRVALCRLLLSAPDLLLLDEPTNHLDAESVAWLERYLADYKGAVVAVTHDRYFLDNVAGWILELDRGRGIPYEGNYTSLAGAEGEAPGDAGAARSGQGAHHQGRARVGPQEPQGPPDQAEGSYLQLRGAWSPKRRTSSSTTSRSTSRSATHLGNVVVQAEKLRKGFGDKLLIDDLEFDLPPGGIVGVIGPNGAGKTTLFKMIAGQEQPDEGALRIGDTVQISYVDQSRDSLDGEKIVWEEISGGLEQITVGTRVMNSRAYTSGLQLQEGRAAEEDQDAVGR